MKRKIQCVITGNSFIASPPYWEKKLKDFGSKENLDRLYVCQKAKNLLLKKYPIERIRSMIDCETDNEITQDHYDELYKLYSKNKINKNISPPEYKEIKEDPEVTAFINRIK